jgi:hypothetical protein
VILVDRDVWYLDWQWQCRSWWVRTCGILTKNGDGDPDELGHAASRLTMSMMILAGQMCGIQTDFMFQLSLVEAYNRKKKKKNDEQQLCF